MPKLLDSLRVVIAAAFLAVAAAVTPAFAVEPGEMLQDPALEARARTLSAELRCLVCQNQSIDDSNAPLARDLRMLVRERLKEGDSDGQILDFVVARYGEFVLLRPRFSPSTVMLWLSPLLVLGLGVWLARGAMARRGTSDAGPRPLTADDEARLSRILSDERDGAA